MNDLDFKNIENITDEKFSKLTNKEKAMLLYGDGSWKTHAIEEKHVNSVEMHDGPSGMRVVGDELDSQWQSAPATCYPAPCLLACSWDEEVLRMVGNGLAKDAKSCHTDVLLAPGVNIKRNPLGGRNFEYFSEDPYLAGKMACGYINGLQEKNVGACLKHFAANNQETFRLLTDSQIDLRALHEIYLRPFKIAIQEAKPWSIMCAYNQINGIYASDNEYLLKDMLRDSWKYEGIVMSDWGATNDPIRCHTRGLNLEMPSYEKNRYKDILRGLKNGWISYNEFNDRAREMVRFSCIVDKAKSNKTEFEYEDNHELCRKAAEESIVLLKNESNSLPFRNYNNSVLIGTLADNFRFQGAGSSKVNTKNVVSILDAIKKETNNKIKYYPGYSLNTNISNAEEEQLENDAVDAASKADRVIFVMGLPEICESEGYDRSDMLLPEYQTKLLNKLVEANNNIHVIILTGAPVELPFNDKVKSILLPYLSGEAGGEAINNVLLGRVNPSGRLPESWPLTYNDVPCSRYYPGNEDVCLYKESIYVGYRYYLSADIKTRYPFGYGLTYSDFKYSRLKLSSDVIKEKDKIKVSFDVTNNSPIEGKEVSQLYIERNEGNAFKALRELKRFAKISLKPGETKTVEFEISYDDFTHFDIIKENYVVEEGKYRICICSDCETVLFNQAVQVEGCNDCKDNHYELPAYYNLTNKSLFVPSDNEFERLLGHRIPPRKIRRRGKFTLNSSMNDIKDTPIGKIISYITLSYMKKRFDEETIRTNYNILLMMPIRSLLQGGFKEKWALAVCSFANRRIIQGCYNFFFGKRK